MKSIAGLLRYYLLGCLMIVGGVGMEMMTMKVGVILDLNSLVGNMSLSCINMSFADFYASHPNYGTTISLYIRDSKADPLIAAMQAKELIQKFKVEAILGPEKWDEAYFVRKLGEKAEVPIISFAPTITTTTSSSSLSYSFQLAQTHSFQVQAISDIITTFKWKHVVAIHNEDDEIGKWFAADLTNALQDAYVHVRKTTINSTISSKEMEEKLYRFTLRQARVFVVHLEHNLASRVFAIADQLGMMSEGYVWIVTPLTSNVFNSTLNSSTLYTMQGVLGVKTYVPRTTELDNFITRWRRINNNSQDGQIDVNGLWAYDAAWALAMAVDTIGRTTHRPNFSTTYGNKIRESLLKTKFKGLSGEVNLVKLGKLKWGNLEIVNVLGKGEKAVGYWRPGMGLTGELNRPKGNLKSIIWPGYSVGVPKGWGTIEGRRLKVGVAMNDEFHEFASLLNGTMVGYCIDIFEEVVRELPYDLQPDYVAFKDPQHYESASYDHLIMEVFHEKYDIAIGDITILAKRSSYVDFTLPFTEAGIVMVIPISRNLTNHKWLFLKPLNLKLWITSLCFFIFMGLVVWILEHQNHQQFRGLPFHNIGNGLWISFCTIVFAHWETLTSNLSRFVMVLWLFIMFILTQSYTASLTSWLTVQQLQPTHNIDYIIKNNWRVGYQNGSYVLQILKGLGIKNLSPYYSAEDLHCQFTNESCHGQIDAVIDEIPYMQFFLSRYPGDYMMADSRFKANGFGFAFPLGSSIVEDMSRAVLTVTEGDKMSKIQEKWFANKTGSHSSSSKDISSSSQLDLSYFWALFVIAASAAIFVLVLYFFISLHNRRTLSDDTTMWKRISLHLFKLKDDDNDSCRREAGGIDVELPGVVDASFPPSPCDDSIHSSECLNKFENHSTHG